MLGNTDSAQALNPKAKEKIAAEPKGATNIFSFAVGSISCTLSRVSKYGLGIIISFVFSLKMIALIYLLFLF